MGINSNENTIEPDRLIKSENDEFQVLLSLRDNRKKRKACDEIFIEGIESIKQAFDSGITVSRIIVPTGRRLSLWAQDRISRYSGVPVVGVLSSLYSVLCEKNEPAEMVITAVMPDYRITFQSLPEAPALLIVDRPSDKGNLGSLIRSANAFGIDAVLIVGHGVDIWDPRVIRTSLGAVFHTPVTGTGSFTALEALLSELKERCGLNVFGTDSTGAVSLADADIHRPAAVVLGNEAKGMSIQLASLCDTIVKIPLSGKVNSLNIACAGTVFLWSLGRSVTDSL